MKLAQVRWTPANRIISTRFPAVNLFESLAPPEEWEALAQLEALTNPRFLDEVGDLGLVPTSAWKGGPGASFLMAPFTHPRPGRFSTAAWGALYAVEEEATAISETVHHQSAFCRNSQLGPVDLDVRVLGLAVIGRFHDLRRGHPECHRPDDCGPSQALAARLRAEDSRGARARTAWPSSPPSPPPAAATCAISATAGTGSASRTSSRRNPSKSEAD